MEYNYRIYHVNGINLNVIDEGGKGLPVIVFLHGFPEFSYGWKNQIPFFLNKGYRVIVPDQRGYNLSDKPANVSAYKTDQLVKDIIELIKLSGSGKVYLVGHDWGAAIAWRMAIQFPELIYKLVIINVPHPMVMKETLKKNPRQMLKSWYIAFFQIPLLPEKLLSAFQYKFLSQMLLRSSAKGIFTPEEIEKYKKAWKRKGALKGMINWYRAALRFDRSSSQTDQKVKIPTLIQWGVQDLALVEDMAKGSLKYCEKGSLKIYPDATHWIHHEKIEEVNRSIYEFIS